MKKMKTAVRGSAQPWGESVARSVARGGLALALTAGLAGGGCGDGLTYSYTDVHVAIDRETISTSQLFLVTSCEFQVTGAETSVPFDFRCPENNVPYDVGTFQWTSKTTGGSLQFLVQVFDGNHNVVGEGTSDPVLLMPGKLGETSVLVKNIAP